MILKCRSRIWTINMNSIKGTFQMGQILFTNPPDWPDGTPVMVEPVTPVLGRREEEWDNTPEGIKAWLAWYDSLEPLEMTPEEEAAWQAERAEQREFEKSKFDERANRIEGLFE